MICKICHSRNLIPIHPTATGGPWWHCLDCNSSSSEEKYNVSLYADHLTYYRNLVGSFEYSRHEQETNVRYFQTFRHLAPNLDFLDVGHCDGAALANMQEEGWSVHGFDVSDACNFGPHTTIAPEFKASLFPRQYGAIQCREVIEHVHDWASFLDEMANALCTSGLLQIQTPRPWCERSHVYASSHLQIFSITSLRDACTQRGLRILDSKVWDAGQLLMLQKA